MEDLLQPVMFDIPSRQDVAAIVIDGDVVRGQAEPQLVERTGESKKSA